MPHLYREDLVCISGKREPVDEDLSFLVDGIFHFARGVRTRTTEPHVHHGLEMDAKIAECLVRRNISMLTLATWRRAKLINQSAYKFQSLEAQLLTSANLLQWGNILKMVRGIEVPSQCKEIQKLPSGIGKLTNLRHLGIGGTDALGYLPQGIGSLRFLEH
ncbi:hypothetical protein IFM89_006922 [Coptis chinensis]|uniref:Uncharacterized protein n=1 Tax=Coptis chinensis TaxID=261450 RepID=A0A835HBH9_9MAGN|nr:hypothetical protein IFM89_006922 [Coptis chinensis]